MMKHHNIPTIVAKSRYEAAVDEGECEGCGKCRKACPMDAISWKGKKPDRKVAIDYVRCIGCGLCVSQCDELTALSLRPRAEHKPPADDVFDFFQQRYRECKGEAPALGTRIALGVSRTLFKLSPLAISGTKYRPKV